MTWTAADDPPRQPTDPTGWSFLSYRRARLHEAQLLLQAQHDLGIPTWQDLHNLGPGQTELELRRALDDPSTASAIMWLTPEVQDSPVIRDLEAPAIVRRSRAGDGFFVVPVAAGGLDYQQAAKVAGPLLGTANLAAFNMRHVNNDPITAQDANSVARRVLDQRLTTIHRHLGPGQPLSIRIVTRGVAPTAPHGHALIVDWTAHFPGPTHRLAGQHTWERTLLPALGQIADAIQRHTHQRPVLASGSLALPAAVALGVAFLEPRQIPLAWQQHRDEPTWSLTAPRETAGFTGELIPNDSNGTDLAVLIGVNADVRPTFGLTADATNTLAHYRAILEIRPPSEPYQPTHTLTAGQATDIALTTRDQLRRAHADYPSIRTVHLFMAVPAGLAVLIGQLLNTLGPVQTYEHLPSAPVPYQPAALLHPSKQ